MAEIELDFELDGLGTLEQDSKEIIEYIYMLLQYKVLPKVQEDMRDALNRHIEKDVYEAYPKPKRYERRRNGENALNDLDNPDIFMRSSVIATQPYGSQNGNGEFSLSAGIYYTPSGKHHVKRWSSDTPEEEQYSLGVYNVDGDLLIGRIEDKTPDYNWGDGVPKRPFWQKFVTELVEDEGISVSVAEALKTAGFDVQMEKDDVIREPQDGDY